MSTAVVPGRRGPAWPLALLLTALLCWLGFLAMRTPSVAVSGNELGLLPADGHREYAEMVVEPATDDRGRPTTTPDTRAMVEHARCSRRTSRAR